MVPWTSNQRGVMAVLLAALCAYLLARYVAGPLYVPDTLTPEGLRAGGLQDRLDPNTAGWAELASLPTLGEKRARAIVEWREAHGGGQGGPVFRTLADLEAVKGIGPATLKLLEPHLRFPATAPAAAGPAGR